MNTKTNLFSILRARGTLAKPVEVSMGQLKTKDEILEYLKKQTEHFQIEYLNLFTTSTISKNLSISRSLTSLYLNELCKDKEIIKVTSRPVYFFSRKVLEKRNNIILERDEFFNIGDLLNILKLGSEQTKDFMRLIGYDGSLAYCVTQIKSALLYPPHGFPIILHGTNGSGKRYIAKLTYEFLINQKILENSSSFEIVNAEDNNFTEQLLETIAKSNNGLLLFENSEKLSAKAKDIITSFLYSHTFSSLNSEKKQESYTRIILSMNDNPQDVFDENFLLSFPLSCVIPSLSQRPAEEKEELLLHFLNEEEVRIDKEIYISRPTFHILSQYSFSNNIYELRKTVLTTCANALLESEDKPIVSIHLLHLPVYILQSLKKEEATPYNSNDMIQIRTFKKRKSSNELIYLFDKLLDSYLTYEQESLEFDEFIDKCSEYMRNYYDFIVFEDYIENDKIKTIEIMVDKVLDSVHINQKIIIPANFTFIMAREIASISNVSSTIQNWAMERREDLDKCISSFSKYMPAESAAANYIIQQINSAIDIRLTELHTLFLVLNLKIHNKPSDFQSSCAIIISHGYSTATSIADAANRILNTHLFKAIDMPLDTTVDEIEHRLNDFINLNTYYQDIIILVDMGSLEQIGSTITKDINLGIINNISTGLALEVGSLMSQHMNLEEILKTACNNYHCHYRIIERQKLEQAIVFTNDVSPKVTKKMIELFRDSIPNDINIKLIEYDYERLLNNGVQDVLFKKYEVILLVKPESLRLDEINSITLDDIIRNKNIERVHNVLAKHMNDEQLKEFDQLILKNFSLQGIMENLTILNPTKLMDFVYESIDNLQISMKKRFANKTIIGIYIHVSFLIERLVTKTEITTYEPQDDFIKEKDEFTQKVNQSFKQMLNHYNVEIPESEIAYLYDYILHEKG